MIFSTDDFFVRDGEYKFNPAALGHAHCWNQVRAIQSMIAGTELVIIDNTNTQAWEAKVYVQAAINLGYKVEIVEPSTTWAFNPDQLALKTTHNVPIDSVRNMLARWEKDLTVEKILASCPPY
jgi:NEDD4-binding protein 2